MDQSGIHSFATRKSDAAVRANAAIKQLQSDVLPSERCAIVKQSPIDISRLNPNGKCSSVRVSVSKVLGSIEGMRACVP